MKKIIFTRPDGGLTVVHPAEGARLAYRVTLADGTVMPSANPPAPVDTILRQWPVQGVTADWAETEDEFIARIAAKDVPADAIEVQTVDESAIPADRTFRNAWKAGKGRIEHDMNKCRAIHREALRAVRAPKLAKLDVEYMRALEGGNSQRQAEIAARKQVLRDVTKDPSIDAARTPTELKKAVPSALTEEDPA